MNIKFIKASDTYLIRQSVLRPLSSINDVAFDGDHDENTFHLGAEDKQALVGIVSCYRRASDKFSINNAWQLRGMATLPEYQGRGFGQLLVLAALEEVKRRGGDNIWCNAREAAALFYKKLHFRIEGDMFNIPGIGPHYLMWRTV